MMKALVLVIAALALAACGQREQIAEGKRAYQGKPDTPSWGDGDRAKWEAGIKERQITQNEYARIGR
jgi:hypothetical protein